MTPYPHPEYMIEHFDAKKAAGHAVVSSEFCAGDIRRVDMSDLQTRARLLAEAAAVYALLNPEGREVVSMRDVRDAADAFNNTYFLNK